MSAIIYGILGWLVRHIRNVHLDDRVESRDFGPCKCGQLKLVIGVKRDPYDYDLLTYQHGEYIFKLSALDPDKDIARRELMELFLERIGCGLK